MTRVALMAAVTAVAAQIAIPLPFSPVPFTLQVQAVVLSGLLLGSRHGALAQAIYVLVGAVGVPVFAGFKGGLGVIFGPTGGYLVSYPLAAAVAGLAAYAVARSSSRRRALTLSFLCGVAALAVIYAIGAGWLSVVTDLPLTVATAVTSGEDAVAGELAVMACASAMRSCSVNPPRLAALRAAWSVLAWSWARAAVARL